jgi:hypothetical protein
VDLALGVAVAGPVARFALIESGNGSYGVIDESVVDLAEDPIARLTETVVGTSRSLADQYHRLVATRLCWSDQHRANQLRQVLDDSGVQNVAVLSESQAATAMSSLPVAAPDDPDFAIARGAALDAATGRLSYPAVDATALAPVSPTDRFSSSAGDPTTASRAAPMTEAFTGAEDATRAAAMESGPQLAYSLEDDDSELLPMEYGGDDDDQDLGAAALPAGRALLVGSAAGGILVAGIAALAVAVTIGVRPTAATHPQPPAPAQQKPVPGNFVPALPAPIPQAPPMPVPDVGVPQGGPGPVPVVGGGGGADQAPPAAPASPPDAGPGVVPPPVPGVIPIPIPVPIPIPFPHQHPHPNTTGGTTGGTTAGTTGGTTTGGTTGGTTTGGTTAGTTGGTTTGGTTGGTTTGGTTSGTTSGTTTGGVTTGGVTNGGATTGGVTNGGATTGGGTTGGGTSHGSTTGGATTGGVTNGGATTGGSQPRPPIIK